MIYLTVNTRDPLVARDGRPFGAGQGHHMRSLDWPYPSVLAGSLRTLLGKLSRSQFDEETVAALKALSIAGPLPLARRKLFFPAARDIVFKRDETAESANKPLEVFRRRPFDLGPGEGSNMVDGLLPLQLSPAASEDFKAETGPAFWARDTMASWLATSDGRGFAPPSNSDGIPREHLGSVLANSGYLAVPAKEQRTHVQLDPDVLTAKEGLLFSTTGLAFDHQVQVAARVNAGPEFADTVNHLSSFHPFGGERRLAHWSRAEGIEDQWTCPNIVRQALAGTPGVRMVLATPALFGCGWKPKWLGQDLAGTVPGTGVSVRLKAAVIERWKPISGWGLELGQLGPKPVRRLVPAGAVYFFGVEQGEATELADRLWLESVCDEPQDRRDGFGLALWGVWDGKVEKGGS